MGSTLIFLCAVILLAAASDPQPSQPPPHTAKVCCMGMTASCLSCTANVTVGEYCSSNPNTMGCPPPRMCCKALTADCMSCTQGVTVEEYCRKHSDTHGCPPPKQQCCTDLTVRCMACMQGLSEAEYCANHPHTYGCHIGSQCVDERGQFKFSDTACTAAFGVATVMGLLMLTLAVLWGLYERRRRRSANPQTPRFGHYATRLWDCFSRATLCIPASFFTPVLAAFNRAQIDGRECTVCDVCAAAVNLPASQYQTRQTIRGRYLLADAATDMCSSICCSPCAVAQDALELEQRALETQVAGPAQVNQPYMTVAPSSSSDSAPTYHEHQQLFKSDAVPEQDQV